MGEMDVLREDILFEQKQHRKTMHRLEQLERELDKMHALERRQHWAEVLRVQQRSIHAPTKTRGWLPTWVTPRRYLHCLARRDTVRAWPSLPNGKQRRVSKRLGSCAGWKRSRSSTKSMHSAIRCGIRSSTGRRHER